MTRTQQKIVNILQVAVCFLWTANMILIALFSLVFTGRRKIPLDMAHWAWGPVINLFTGARLKVQGLENVDFSKPHIFVMNHQSTLDIPLIFEALPTQLRFILKKELIFAPFVGLYAWAMGMIFIDRKNHDAALKSLEKAAKRISKGASIIAYPEGTRSDDGSVLEFKKGVFVLAIQSKVPVVPIAIEGSRFVMPKNTFRLTPHDVIVSVGKPIPTFHLSLSDRDALIAQVHTEVVRLHTSIGGKQPSEAKSLSTPTTKTSQSAS